MVRGAAPASGVRHRAVRLIAATGVAAIAFAIARRALLPGVEFWDTAELQTVGPLMGTAHPTGFPTYVLLGWVASVLLQPLGEPAFRMNLLSAICLAVAAGLTVDLARALTGRLVLGIGAGAGLALTPLAWSIGTHADAHALHLALVALLLWLLVAWEGRARDAARWDVARPPSANRYLVAAAITFGLALGNHFLVLLLAPAIVAFVHVVQPWIRARRWFVLGCLGAIAFTVAIVYLELPLRAGPFRAPLVYGHPETWDGFWYVALGQQFQGSLVDPFGDLPRKLGQLIGRTMDEFGALAPLLPVAFAATAWRRPRYALLTGLAVLLTCFFAASYENADIGRYYLGPILMAWTWLAVLADVAVGPVRRVLEPLLTRRADALVGATLAAILVAPGVVDAPAVLPTLDQSHDHEAADWTDDALAAMEPNAVVVSWWSYSTPLWYAQRVEGRRPDVAIVDDRTRLDDGLGELTDVIDANLGRRPVYVIRSDPEEVAMLAARYHLEPLFGVLGFDLTRVVERREAGS